MRANIEPHIVSKCGRRPSNEDVESYLMNLSADGYKVKTEYAGADFFVICDGHGGRKVAEFVVPYLQKCLMKNTLVYPLAPEYINRVYNFIQEKLRQHPQYIANYCGCTALVVVLYLDSRNRRHAQIINLGDCRAVLSANGKAVPLTLDHKPSWPDEKKRIDSVNLKNGTNEKIKFIEGDFRIGDLSVSRSFGDLDNCPFITHMPDIFTHRINGTDEFIILACDGLWDVLRNEEAVNFVRDHRDNNQINLYAIPRLYPPPNNRNAHAQRNNIAEKLADYAIARGSTDNVSIIIIFLNKS
jgi:serine/threonine protein phosphatase PrpC